MPTLMVPWAKLGATPSRTKAMAAMKMRADLMSISPDDAFGSAADYNRGCASTATVRPSLLHEEEILAARQRAVGIRLLPAGGGLHHVITNQPEQLVDLDIGCRE